MTLKQKKPEFYLIGLQPGMNFIISVYASNDKGRSEVYSIASSTKEAPPRPPGAFNF